MKPYCFWDMDHTLIDNDCDVSWKVFLVEEGLAPQQTLEEAEGFFQDYLAGRLDVEAFLRFQLKEFRHRRVEEMTELSRRHFSRKVAGRFYREAVDLIRRQQRAGSKVYLLTATNRVIAQPVAEALGLDDIIATELALDNGVYTGALAGIYSVGEGKLARLKQFCAQHGISADDCAAWGDSINDRFVLDWVGAPHAVNPGRELATLAKERGWSVVYFRETGNPDAWGNMTREGP